MWHQGRESLQRSLINFHLYFAQTKGNTTGWKMTFQKSKLIDNRPSLPPNFHGNVETWCSYRQILCSVGDCWTHSEKKTSRGRKSLSSSVRDNCCLCVKFGSQGIILELRTCFSALKADGLVWCDSCETVRVKVMDCQKNIARQG